MDNLLAAGLDDAGGNDEYDRKYGAYGDGQVRFFDFTNWRYLGICRLEFIRGNFCMDFSDNLQPFNQELKPPREKLANYNAPIIMNGRLGQSERKFL